MLRYLDYRRSLITRHSINHTIITPPPGRDWDSMFAIYRDFKILRGCGGCINYIVFSFLSDSRNDYRWVRSKYPPLINTTPLINFKRTQRYLLSDYNDQKPWNENSDLQKRWVIIRHPSPPANQRNREYLQYAVQHSLLFAKSLQKIIETCLGLTKIETPPHPYYDRQVKLFFLAQYIFQNKCIIVQVSN